MTIAEEIREIAASLGTTARCGAQLESIAQRIEFNQRMWDLVRFMRADLHNDGLITDEEYTELAQDHAAVKRLEDYDVLRLKMTAVNDLVKRFERAVSVSHSPVTLKWCTDELKKVIE